MGAMDSDIGASRLMSHLERKAWGKDLLHHAPTGAPKPIERDSGEEAARVTDMGHEAFYKHDTARNLTHKAVSSAEATRTMPDADKARNALFDAARSHRAAAREFGSFSQRLRDSGRSDSAKMATEAAKEHRNVADMAESATRWVGARNLPGKAGAFQALRDAVSNSDSAADRLSSSL